MPADVMVRAIDIGFCKDLSSRFPDVDRHPTTSIGEVFLPYLLKFVYLSI